MECADNNPLRRISAPRGYPMTQLVGGPIQQAWSLATEVAFYLFVPVWAWLM